MKRLTIAITFLILFVTNIVAQQGFVKLKDTVAIVKLDPDFFLLGTFSDYMGRFQYIDREKQIDRYYPFEEPLVNYLTNFIKSNYNIQVDTVFKMGRHSEMFSKTLAGRLHSYYDGKGNIKDDIFTTDEKKYSFITGLFYRYGERLQDSIYRVQVTNSPKRKEIYDLLQALKCDKIIYKFQRGIPSTTNFYFEAPSTIQQYFNLVQQENEKLRKSFMDVGLYSLFKDHDFEAMKKKIEKGNIELLNNIKAVFR